MSSSPVQLLRDSISTDSLEAVESIREGIQSGQIIGFAFALWLRGRRYMVNVSGQCARDPTFTRGMLGALDDELSRMIQGRTDSDTTI